MDRDNFKRADEIDVSVSLDEDLPDGWEQTHEEYKRPVQAGLGYYLYQYESEHFLISREVDKFDGETIHNVSLLKVKRDDETGERLTALGTGIFYIVGVEDGRQAFSDGSDEVDWDDNEEAHREAERAAFQLVIDLMNDVNNGKYDDKRFSN